MQSILDKAIKLVLGSSVEELKRVKTADEIQSVKVKNESQERIESYKVIAENSSEITEEEREAVISALEADVEIEEKLRKKLIVDTLYPIASQTKRITETEQVALEIKNNLLANVKLDWSNQEITNTFREKNYKLNKFSKTIKIVSDGMKGGASKSKNLKSIINVHFALAALNPDQHFNFVFLSADANQIESKVLTEDFVNSAFVPENVTFRTILISYDEFEAKSTNQINSEIYSKLDTAHDVSGDKVGFEHEEDREGDVYYIVDKSTGERERIDLLYLDIAAGHDSIQYDQPDVFCVSAFSRCKQGIQTALERLEVQIKSELRSIVVDILEQEDDEDALPLSRESIDIAREFGTEYVFFFTMRDANALRLAYSKVEEKINALNEKYNANIQIIVIPYLPSIADYDDFSIPYALDEKDVKGFRKDFYDEYVNKRKLPQRDVSILRPVLIDKAGYPEALLKIAEINKRLEEKDAE